jgi:hypothetical protein
MTPYDRPIPIHKLAHNPSARIAWAVPRTVMFRLQPPIEILLRSPAPKLARAHSRSIMPAMAELAEIYCYPVKTARLRARWPSSS